MVNPPEAEPVSAANTLVAAASETSGPPEIPSTQSRTAANAGISATTAPKPTRLATLSAGSTEALAPASTVSRNLGSRPKFNANTVIIAQASAVTTAQTPPTAARDVSPQRGSERNEVLSLGRMINDVTMLTAITTTRGIAAVIADGAALANCPLSSSAGSNSCAVVARSRATLTRSTSFDCAESLLSSKPWPKCRALASARFSHHMPKPNMMADATIPRPGAANGVVPKNGIGIAFWMDGVPGKADMVKVEVPSAMAAGISRRGTLAARNNSCAIGPMTKNATNKLAPP